MVASSVKEWGPLYMSLDTRSLIAAPLPTRRGNCMPGQGGVPSTIVEKRIM